MKKGTPAQRLRQFAETKGFYVVMALCAVAIGISGYVLFFTGGEEEGGAQLSGQQTLLPQEDASVQTPNVTVEPRDDSRDLPPEKVIKPAAEPKTPVTPAPDPAPVSGTEVLPTANTEPVQEPVYALPVRESEIQRPFSGEELVFDETMGDWRTHNGTDFACDEGDEVLAILDGTVTETWDDGLMGACVRIDHGAGRESVYCGLASSAEVKPGAQVKAGQTIGRAGGSMPSESAQDCHLHLELLENGARVDPMDTLCP